MRQKKAGTTGWFSILSVLFLCFAAYMPCSMGSAQAAYSPEETYNGQAGQQAQGNGGSGATRNAVSQGSMTPAQTVDPMLEEQCIHCLPAQAPMLPGLHATAYPAVCSLMYIRPLSELASRTGGHAPP